MRKRLAVTAVAVVAATATALLGHSSSQAEALTAKQWTQQGLADTQRVRDTGDARYYGSAERAFREALALEPTDLAATLAFASLRLSQHQFRSALALGRRAQRISPSTAAVYGAIGDAQLELGRYGAAVASFNRMAALKPSSGAYARISYAAELQGDFVGARAAMNLARDAAVGHAATLAWIETQLADLSGGDLAAAERHARRALALNPRFARALDALADVAAARGHLERALTLERRAIRLTPSPHYVAALADLHAVARNPAAERAAVRRADRLFDELSAHGERVALERALFYADLGVRPRQAVALARAGRAQRPSILGDDVLAWSLTRAARCGEARLYSQRSIRLAVDAVKAFHRAELERCLGNTADARRWYARALHLDPYFSIRFAERARAALA